MNLNSINNKPTCDNECELYGWTHEYIIYSTGDDTLNMHVSIHPDADRDATIDVFSHDEQRIVRIHAWVWKWERLNGK